MMAALLRVYSLKATGRPFGTWQVAVPQAHGTGVQDGMRLCLKERVRRRFPAEE